MQTYVSTRGSGKSNQYHLCTDLTAWHIPQKLRILTVLQKHRRPSNLPHYIPQLVVKDPTTHTMSITQGPSYTGSSAVSTEQIKHLTQEY